MVPRLSSKNRSDYGAVLLCPKCGFEYLHHDKVEVFDRIEDATTGLHVTVMSEPSRVNVDESIVGNPSSRRHGVRIEFWCEGCSERSALTLAQHKGVTELDQVILGVSKK